jgi:hypothetical protein
MVVGSIVVSHPLIYYQKPAIGNDNGRDAVPPAQVIFPSGGFSIAVTAKQSENDEQQRGDGNGTLASAPSNSQIDISERFGLRIAFALMGILNIVLTALMYRHAHTVDVTKVEFPRSGLPAPFEIVARERSYIENVNFAFTIFLMSLGIISVIFENTSGLSAYCLGIVVNFFLGTYSLPYFFYSLRYILDIFMLYCGLVLRSRYMYSFLPLHLHRT